MSPADAPAPTLCGTCLHWHDLGVNPGDIASGRQGECREQPHVIPVQRGLLTVYAVTPERFPACSRHSPRPKVVLA